MLFDFNRYSSLLLPCVLQGGLFVALYSITFLLQRKMHHLLLAGILLLYTIYVAHWMIGFAGWYDSHDTYTTFAFYFPWANWFALGPLVYYYFRFLTNREYEWKRNDAWHFLLPILEYGYSLLVFVIDVLVVQELPFHFNTHGYWRAADLGWVEIARRVVVYLSIFYYLIRTIQLFRQYDRYLVDHFSETEHVNYRWLRWFLYAILATQSVQLVFDLVTLFGNDNLSFVQNWYKYLVAGVLIYYISLAPFRNEPRVAKQLAFTPDTRSVTTSIVNPNLKPNHENSSNSNTSDLMERIRKSELYLREDLTLSELATALRIPDYQLSRLLNEAEGQNFNTCINQLRINEVQRRLLDQSQAHLSLLGIAYDCGFSSKATFNRVFKQYTGQSPTDWKKSQIQ